jgi:protein-tyrosine kinase
VERIQRALELAHVRRAMDAESPLAGHSSQEERAMLRSAAQAADVAVLPKLAIDRAKLRSRKVVFPEDASAAARAYRMLRAQVLHRARASGLGAIGIVSSASGEGKTLTAVNLALSLAADPNHSVTLIDLDLRRPSVAATLGVNPPLGLDGWLIGEHPVASVLYGLEGVDRLSLIPTVAPMVAASEALAGGKTRDLIEAARSAEGRKVVVVDLPPALLSDHVLTVAPLLDGFVLVVTEGQTLRDDVERVFELLGRDRIIGTVLNRSSDSEQRAY